MVRVFGEPEELAFASPGAVKLPHSSSPVAGETKREQHSFVESPVRFHVPNPEFDVIEVTRFHEVTLPRPRLSA